MRFVLPSASVLVLAFAGGCAGEVTSSEDYLALEAQLADAEQERAYLAAQLEAEEDLPPILDEFKAAFESGDIEQIRALFTEDGIFITTDEIHGLYHGNDEIRGNLGPLDAEFERRSTVHYGELEVFDPVVVGDRAVAFGWRWSDFASGTATAHLRDGRIAVLDLTITELPIAPIEPAG